MRLDLTDNERAILITALRRLVELLNLDSPSLRSILPLPQPHDGQILKANKPFNFISCVTR